MSEIYFSAAFVITVGIISWIFLWGGFVCERIKDSPSAREARLRIVDFAGSIMVATGTIAVIWTRPYLTPTSALLAVTLSALTIGALAGWAVAFRTRLPGSER